MPIRLRIAILFTGLVTIILGLLCLGIYYFSYAGRLKTIKTRLENRAITTARLLAQREIFDEKLVKQIDSLTTIALKNKTVQAYDHQNRKIYSYSDKYGDTLHVTEDVLNDARINETKYFNVDNKEAVAFHYWDNNVRIVVISAGEDIDGKQGLISLRNILLFSFLVGIAFVLISGYIFSDSLLRPIKKITLEVEEISAQNLARRIDTGSSKDEWHKLASTFNDLLNRLQESFDLQRRFISNASHELSTPLTSISSQIEVSLQRQRDAGDYRQVMLSIYQDVKHMSKLTQTLLEFAKASGDKGGLEINLIRIDEVVLSIPSEMAKINSAYSVSIAFENLPEDDKSLLVFGNETLLATATRNIVMNACKYSRDHQAKVSLQPFGKQILISVSDKGKGIPETELKTIFQPFYRLESDMPTEGFGLGLSLAERIIKIHKGMIDVKSKEGEGATFNIYLPAAKYLGTV